ncbi:MAG: hypothetical protein U9Q74_07325 [Gemmatimonadota bacterium]|nr:hypothetical protein [Gemmatimonadota bacterium]
MAQIRELSDGRVIMNDNVRRRLLVYEPTLTRFTALADSAGGSVQAYGPAPLGLLRGKGDTTWIVDPVSLSILVLDSACAVVRVKALPFPDDVARLLPGRNGSGGLDARGRLVYRGFGMEGGRSTGAGIIAQVTTPDSLPIVRIDMATRAVDTVSFVRPFRSTLTLARSAEGRLTSTELINPLQVVDEWTVTSDDRIVIVRGKDYSIEFLGERREETVARVIPFPWRAMSDSAKAAFLDSARVAAARLRDGALAAALAGESAGRASGVFRPADGGTPFAAEQVFVDALALPDYAPPFLPGAVVADRAGNVWIRTSNTSNGQPVYDVVNSLGRLVDRVRLPSGRVIVGFGRTSVFLAVRGANGLASLEKATVR